MTKLFDHVSFDKKACFTHDNYVYKDIESKLGVYAKGLNGLM